jgi:hypothetical protein
MSSSKRSLLQPIKVLQCMTFPLPPPLHSPLHLITNRMSHKLLTLSGLVYKDLITAMSELQKSERSTKKLKNKIDSLLATSDSLAAGPLSSSFTPLNETTMMTSSPPSSPPKQSSPPPSSLGDSTITPSLTSLKPSLQFIRKFFEYLPLHVTDISIPLTKQKVCQYFHPSPLTALVSPPAAANPPGVSTPSGGGASAPGEDSGHDLEMNEELFALECSSETLPKIHLRAQNLFAFISSWDQSQWLTKHPTLPILSLQETPEGSLLQLNPAFICHVVSEIYGWQSQPQPLSVEKFLQFLTTNALDLPSFLIVLYLYHFNAAAAASALTNNTDTSFSLSHMEFIDWLNSLLSSDNQSLPNVFQEEPVFVIKEIPVPSEIYSFLLHCFNGSLPLLPPSTPSSLPHS